MRLETPILRRTVGLKADTPAGRFVGFGGEAPKAGGAALGVSYMAGKAEDNVAVTALGVAVAIAGGALAVGDAVAVGDGGKAVKWVWEAEAAFKTAVVAGAEAGDVAVAGIRPADTLASVIQLDIAGQKGVTDAADLTGEFSIKASEDGKVNNEGGTGTNGDKLLVAWSRRESPAAVVGRALTAAARDGDEIELLVLSN